LPVTNGKYIAPEWMDQQPPAINDDELGAMSQTIEDNQILYGAGAPTQYTNGKVGQLYVDISVSPNQIWQCRVSATEANVWALNDDPNINLALQYSPSTGYLRGSYRLHNGILYRATVDISEPEAWDAAHWARAYLASDLSEHERSRDNPHGVTASQVGLGNVANVTQYSEDNPPKKTGSITLGTTWTGEASPYTQTVTVLGASVTANSKIDLLPTAAQITSLIDGGVTGLVIENNAGTLTAYALGEAPQAEMTVLCTVEETI